MNITPLSFFIGGSTLGSFFLYLGVRSYRLKFISIQSRRIDTELTGIAAQFCSVCFMLAGLYCVYFSLTVILAASRNGSLTSKFRSSDFLIQIGLILIIICALASIFRLPASHLDYFHRHLSYWESGALLGMLAAGIGIVWSRFSRR